MERVVIDLRNIINKNVKKTKKNKRFFEDIETILLTIEDMLNSLRSRVKIAISEYDIILRIIKETKDPIFLNIIAKAVLENARN